MEEDYAEWLEEAEKKIEHYEEAVEQIKEAANTGLEDGASPYLACVIISDAIRLLEKKLS
jgi:hypothetical protein